MLTSNLMLLRLQLWTGHQQLGPRFLPDVKMHPRPKSHSAKLESNSGTSVRSAPDDHCVGR
eukprot:2394478-Amphidinium_carterae.1